MFSCLPSFPKTLAFCVACPLLIYFSFSFHTSFYYPSLTALPLSLQEKFVSLGIMAQNTCFLKPVQLMCGGPSDLCCLSCVSVHLPISAIASFISHTFIWNEMLEFPHSLFKSWGKTLCKVTIMFVCTGLICVFVSHLLMFD